MILSQMIELGVPVYEPATCPERFKRAMKGLENRSVE